MSNKQSNKQHTNLSLFSLGKICLLFLAIGIITTLYYKSLGHVHRTFVLRSHTNVVRSLSNKTDISSYYQSPVPCIEPHCNTQCLTTYQSDGDTKVIDSKLLTDIQREHLMIDLGRDRIVQELLRSIPAPQTCSYSAFSKAKITVKFYPIVFGFAEQYMHKPMLRQVLMDNQSKTVEQICLPRKAKDFNDLIPGKIETYKFIFENELDYRRLYSNAYFAITTKKGGWDWNRHYEILSSGTVPFFDQLDQAGSHTLALLPKPLLYAAQKLPGVDRTNLKIDHSVFDANQYYLLLHRLLYYARQRLTTVKLVEYILSTTNYSLSPSEKHSILFISHTRYDYQKDFLIHGFTHLFQENLHVYQPPQYLYDYPSSSMWTASETTNYYKFRLYGFGYNYKLILKDYVHLYERDKHELADRTRIETQIRRRNYSLIVYGSILRADEFFSLAKEYYPRSRIILIDGEDESKDKRRIEYAKWGTYFLRELPSCYSIIWNILRMGTRRLPPAMVYSVIGENGMYREYLGYYSVGFCDRKSW